MMNFIECSNTARNKQIFNGITNIKVSYIRWSYFTNGITNGNNLSVISALEIRK